jgi:hypothetical protein
LYCPQYHAQSDQILGTLSDSKGRTARDLAEKLQKPSFVYAIDEYIIKLIKDKKFNEVEQLILHNYDHLLDITDSSKVIRLCGSISGSAVWTYQWFGCMDPFVIRLCGFISGSAVWIHLCFGCVDPLVFRCIS